MEILTASGERRLSSWGFGRTLSSFILLLVGGWIAGGTFVGLAQEPAASETAVKAAFLINFPKYAEWPAGAFVNTNSPIIFAVLGESKVSNALEELIPGRTINGRSILLKRVASTEEVDAFHILFFPASEQHRAARIIEKLKPGILTVGEAGDFIDSGGVINLARKGQKVSMEVNLQAAAKAQIKISSKLLSLAGEVKGRSK